MVSHEPFRERAARISASVTSATLTRVIGYKRFRGCALRHRAIGASALHHMRENQKVMRLRLHCTIRPTFHSHYRLRYTHY